MSTGLSPLYVIEFDAQVKAAYQAGIGGNLKSAVRVKPGVRGQTVRFRRVNAGIARPHIPSTPRVAMGTTYGDVTCTMQDWDATEYVDQIEQTKVNFDEGPILATNIAAALNRRLDQLVLDALIAAMAGGPTIADGGTGLTDAKLRAIDRFFNDRAVPRGQRKLLLSPRANEQMLGENKFTSRDWVEGAVIRSGQIPQVYGLDLMIVEARPEGGLPIAANIRQLFAFDKNAVGLGIAFEETTKVDWVPHLKSWQHNQGLSAGACVIDPQGLLRVDISEA
jgi:hypothetical protein